MKYAMRRRAQGQIFYTQPGHSHSLTSGSAWSCNLKRGGLTLKRGCFSSRASNHLWTLLYDSGFTIYDLFPWTSPKPNGPRSNGFPNAVSSTVSSFTEFSTRDLFATSASLLMGSHLSFPPATRGLLINFTFTARRSAGCF